MGKVSKALNKAQSTLHSASLHQPLAQRQYNSRKTSSGRKIEYSDTKVAKIPPSVAESIAHWDERLISAMKYITGIAESIRKLRTIILHPESGRPARSILMLSSDPQEGKSFVCANLGVSCARSVKQKALMVDCDLRRPSLHGFFGKNNGTNGLTDYLRDGANISSLIKQTGLPKLSYIPAGTPPENPSELLSSEKMSNLIEELTNRYDDRLILLDSPPFHAASETLVLSQLVDKVVLVVRWGRSGRENVKKMTDHIGREKIIGVVFNAFEMTIIDEKMQGGGYHNYYSEYY